MVMLKDIIYFESCQHNILLQTINKRIEFRCKISEIAKQLEGEGFIRIHKGFIVNVRFMERLTFGKVTLESGQELPVSRSYYENVKRQYLVEMEKLVYG